MFRTLTIKTRLIWSGSISILAILATAGLGLYALWLSNREMEHQIAATTLVQTERAEYMAHDSIKADVLYSVLIGTAAKADEVAELEGELADDTGDLAAMVKQLQGLDMKDEARAALAAIVPLADDYIASALLTSKTARTDDAASHAMLPDFNEKFYTLETAARKFADLVGAQDDSGVATSRQHNLFLSYLMAACAAIAVVVMILAARSTMRAITKPIERLREALARVSQGDFGLRIGKITRDDDIGAIARDIDLVSERVESALREQIELRRGGEHVIEQLGAGLRNLSAGNLGQTIDTAFEADYDALRRDFNDTVDKLSGMMTDVIGVGRTIQARSSELKRASEDLATRTENQAATLEETAAALEEMTSSVKLAADNTKRVESVVMKTRQDVEASNAVVQGAVAAMNEIEESSSKISQIIGVIDDIAFQTNLLALNAGVEAARAGDAGRGFAVVASEVRALAQRSSLAAKEIKTLIGASSEHVQSGVEQVNDAGTALLAVIEKVAEISGLVSAIAEGSREQALGLAEINIGVGQLDQVTQHNAAMVEESGAATQALNHDALEMNEIFGQFVLKDQPAPAKPAPVRSLGRPMSRVA